ncbi:MAG: hypothetical protein ACQGQO_08685 [Sphaerochaetaceae bacterium]
MEFHTLTLGTYEEAVNKARLLYGDSMRISLRRDFTTKGFLGLGKRRKCEITVYNAPSPDSGERASIKESVSVPNQNVLNREEADSYSQYFEENDRQKEQLEPEKSEGIDRTKNEDDQKILAPFLEKARKVLSENDFSYEYSQKLLEDVRKQLEKALPDLPSPQDFEILLLDNFVSSFESDHSTQLYPPSFFVLAGASGSGKTAAASKIGNLFVSGLGKSVEVVQLQNEDFDARRRNEITIDPNGVYHSVHSCKESLERIKGENKRDIYIIDSFSFAANDDQSRDLLLDFYSHLPKDDTKYFLVMDASMKDKDVVKIFSIFEKIDFQSLVLTKCDESETIGNVISVCNRYGIPLLFITDGKDLMSNIHFASSFAVLSKLRGFDLDMNMLVQPS